LLSIASKAAGELDLGELQQALIRGEDGYAILVGASKNTMLMTLAKPDAKLGLVFIEMGRAVEQIRSII
jgi:predicted regulator of Ras-like GTPase activity (Roadblock/LC7/MglB family)